MFGNTLLVTYSNIISTNHSILGLTKFCKFCGLGPLICYKCLHERVSYYYCNILCSIFIYILQRCNCILSLEIQPTVGYATPNLEVLSNVLQAKLGSKTNNINNNQNTQPVAAANQGDASAQNPQTITIVLQDERAATTTTQTSNGRNQKKNGKTRQNGRRRQNGAGNGNRSGKRRV